MKKWMIALTLVAVIIAVPLACVLIERISSAASGDGSVVLVEHAKQTRGMLINGTYLAQKLDGTGYRYDAYQRLLSDSGIKTNGLRAVIGITEGFSQDAGSGKAGDAYGVYSIPAKAVDVTVQELDPDGTVTISYNGTRIVLAPGERWETISTEITCTPEYSIRYTKSDIIRNQGFVSRADIS
jgi:hypothetical protein